MILFLFSAMAHEAPPQDILLSESIPLFVDLGLDSGWVPNTGSLAVRLELVANGNAIVEETGQAKLSWDDTEELQLRMKGGENQGLIALDSALETLVSIRFDLYGYQYEDQLSAFSLPLYNEQNFDSFSLGETIVLETSTDSNAIDFNTTVLLVVDVAFYGIVRPTYSLSYSPMQWDVDGNILEEDASVASFDPVVGATNWGASAKHLAELEASLDIEFVPTFEVCVPVFGCTQWEAVQIPLNTSTDAFFHEFSAIDMSFPLPSLSVAEETIDFGTLAQGELSNHELSFENIGELILEGEARIVSGEANFSVFPDQVFTGQAQEDGLMVSFVGETDGMYEGILEIISNDPSQPVIQIALRANVTADGIEGTDVNGKVGGCGCSTQKTPPLGLLLLFPLLAWWRRME